MSTVRDRPRVVVAHGGVQYSYKTARALHHAGLLHQFITTVYAPPGSALHRTLRSVLPGHPWTAALAERRYDAGLPGDVVRSIVWPELGHRLWQLATGGAKENAALTLRNDLFDRSVARRIRRDPLEVDVFYGFAGGALHAMTESKRRGWLAVLDHHDIWHEAARRLLSEEIGLHPDFAETIPYWPPYEPYLRRLDAEDRLADYHVVLSSFARETYLQAGIPPDRIVLVPLGVDVRRFAPGLPRVGDPFRVLFVGAIGQRKGIKYLLEAMRRLDLPGAEAVLAGTILGSGAPLAPYRQWFRHVGYVAPAVVPEFYRSGSVCVLPSVWDSYGQVVVEAMACGLPVIVTANTAAKDVVRDGVDGFVIPIRDVDALAEKLLLMYEDPERRIAMGRNAAARAQEFGLDTYSTTLGSALAAMWQARRHSPLTA